MVKRNNFYKRYRNNRSNRDDNKFSLIDILSFLWLFVIICAVVYFIYVVFTFKFPWAVADEFMKTQYPDKNITKNKGIKLWLMVK